MLIYFKSGKSDKNHGDKEDENKYPINEVREKFLIEHLLRIINDKEAFLLHHILGYLK